MSFRTFLYPGCVFRTAIGALALILLLGLQPAAAEQADHAAHHDAHKHHKVAPGYQRSLASYSVPNVTMVNQDGQRVALPELLDADAPVMLNFIFTSCTAICPAMSAIFARVQNELGSDSARLRMVSISIDPEYDRPDKLKAYAEQFRAGAGWDFLTGDSNDIVQVLKGFDSYAGSKMNHQPITLLKSPASSSWTRIEGLASGKDLANEVTARLLN